MNRNAGIQLVIRMEQHPSWEFPLLSELYGGRLDCLVRYGRVCNVVFLLKNELLSVLFPSRRERLEREREGGGRVPTSVATKVNTKNKQSNLTRWPKMKSRGLANKLTMASIEP